ncbi:MAG: acyl-CoA thioesterase [bacterium]|nr:acyl-CoA thioesterase [bacterium]
MPRVRLQEQENYEFSCELHVRFYDINLGGHVGTSEMVNLINEARILFLRALDVSPINMGDGKTRVVISDQVVNFRSEAFLGDIVTIDCHTDELEESSLRMFYRVRKGDSIVALSETGIIPFDFPERKKGIVPKEFIEKLEGFKNRE